MNTVVIVFDAHFGTKKLIPLVKELRYIESRK